MLRENEHQDAQAGVAGPGHIGDDAQIIVARPASDTAPAVDGGQSQCDAHTACAPVQNIGGQLVTDTHYQRAADSGQEGHCSGDTHTCRANLPALISAIQTHHRQRVFAMEQRKRLDLSATAFVRNVLGFSTALPADERKAITERANALMDTLEARYRKQQLNRMRDDGEISTAQHRQRTKSLDTDSDDPLLDMLEAPIFATMQGREAFDRLEADDTKELERLGKQLPIWSEFADVPGIRGQTLATILGEAGDLSRYANPGKLWKRMGLALVGGNRQGAPGKNATKDDWIEHGYSPSRRSRMWNIGQALVKTTHSPYRQVYLDRKQVELDKAEAEGLTVKPAAQIKKAEQDQCRSVGHVANRAQRYMEKRLLKDVWQAWRRANVRVTPTGDVPDADEQNAA